MNKGGNGKRIIGVGGANMDIHMKIEGRYILHDSNPGRLFGSAGGVTRNILENLARLGQSCSLITAVGKDPFSGVIIDSCRKVSIDTGMFYVNENEASSSYLDLVDGSGDLFVGACDAGVLEHMPLSHLEKYGSEIASAGAVVCDTNLTEKQLERLTELAESTPLFIDPVSTSKAARIKNISGRFYLIKPNRLELEALAGMECLTDKDIQSACEILLSKGTKCVVVSLGARGCYYADSEGRSFFRDPRKVLDMVNAAGAGDAFTAGLVYSYMKGYSPEKTIDTALGCGSIAVMSDETINPEMSEEMLEKTL